MLFRKIFFQAVLMIAAALGVYIIADIGLTYRVKAAAKLEQLWSEDIQTLAAAQKLPPSWSGIRVVEKISGNKDPMSELWAKTVSSPIEINPNGEYKLEILMLSQKNESGQTRAIIQHHIIHIPSNNSVWELARTYILN